MSELVLGYSENGFPIEATYYTPPRKEGEPDAPTVFCIGGTHADEVEGVWLIEELDARLSKQNPFQKISVLTCPILNPDGYAAGTRQNAHNVDLNRNMPTQDWTGEVLHPKYPPGPAPGSESETRALIAAIEKYKPIAILSAHSFSNVQVNSNGPARAWAEVLATACGYPVTEDIGYPTPGSLGTYAGKERGIPTITLEIERGITPPQVLGLHVPTIYAALEYWEKKQ